MRVGGTSSRITAVGVGALVLLSALVVPTGTSVVQNDADSGGDAGDTFAAATPVTHPGHYEGTLDGGAGDTHDYYRFHLHQGDSATISIEIGGGFVEPIELLDPNGVVIDRAVRVVTALTVTGSLYELRVSVPSAPITGDYRLHLSGEFFFQGGYTMCFSPCDGPMQAPIELFTPLGDPHVRVLLVPPTNGDMGNPVNGPTVVEYIDATLRGIHTWESALDAFAADHPEYDYLADIEIHVEIFDGVEADAAGYDVVIYFMNTSGYTFRGLATLNCAVSAQPFSLFGVSTHTCGRVILLSLFASAARAGQVLPDSPEVNDIESVTLHEFAHTFGLGHTRLWTTDHGPDLMNSPAPFVYGDGDPLGDGGERTPLECISSLDLYGMAVLYAWMETGNYRRPSERWVDAPASMPYELYC